MKYHKFQVLALLQLGDGTVVGCKFGKSSKCEISFRHVTEMLNKQLDVVHNTGHDQKCRWGGVCRQSCQMLSTVRGLSDVNKGVKKQRGNLRIDAQRLDKEASRVVMSTLQNRTGIGQTRCALVCKPLSGQGFPGGSDGKASACNAGDPGLIPGLGRSPGEGNGNPLQYSCLENSMD